MNSILEVANIYLHYRGGKHVGLAGLVGLIVAILIAVMWNDWFQPIINFIGLNRVANNMGIIVDGAGGAAVTTYNVIILYLFFCLTFSLFLGIGLVFFVYGSTALTTNFGATVVGIVIFVVLSPVLIWFVFARDKELEEQRKLAKENPEAFKEEQRLKRNKDLMDYLIRTKEKDGKTNRIKKEHAIQYLHRVPSLEDNHFLIGITYDREPVLLFPRPFGTTIYGTIHQLIGVTLTSEKFIPMLHDPHDVQRHINPECFYMMYGKELKQWNVNEMEELIYPKEILDVQRVLTNFNKQKVYEDYVAMVHKHYEINRNRAVPFPTVVHGMLNNKY